MDARGWAITVWIFYLVSYFTAGFSGLVGVIIAYMKRGDLAATDYDSHMTSAIRTFWIQLVGALVGVVLALVGIGYLILLAIGIWGLFRTIRGLVKAIDGKPIDDPTGWL